MSPALSLCQHSLHPFSFGNGARAGIEREVSKQDAAWIKNFDAVYEQYIRKNFLAATKCCDENTLYSAARNQMVGLLFTMCILVLVTSVCLKVSLIFMAATGVAKLSSYFSGSFGSAGSAASSIMGVAVQQGGLGLLLSTLLLAVPPMVMNFFNATLGGAPMQSWFTSSSTGANTNTNNNNNNNNNGTGNKGTGDRKDPTSNAPVSGNLAQQAEIQQQTRAVTQANTQSQAPAGSAEYSKGAYGNAPKTPNKEG